jgi:hypothetical protein
LRYHVIIGPSCPHGILEFTLRLIHAAQFEKKLDSGSTPFSLSNCGTGILDRSCLISFRHTRGERRKEVSLPMPHVETPSQIE